MTEPPPVQEPAPSFAPVVPSHARTGSSHVTGDTATVES